MVHPKEACTRFVSQLAFLDRQAGPGSSCTPRSQHPRRSTRERTYSHMPHRHAPAATRTGCPRGNTASASGKQLQARRHGGAKLTLLEAGLRMCWYCLSHSQVGLLHLDFSLWDTSHRWITSTSSVRAGGSMMASTSGKRCVSTSPECQKKSQKQTVLESLFLNRGLTKLTKPTPKSKTPPVVNTCTPCPTPTLRSREASSIGSSTQSRSTPLGEYSIQPRVPRKN